MITIAGISDHLRPEWLITITGIRRLPTAHVKKGGRGDLELAFGAGRLGRDQRIDGCGAPRHIVACIVTG
ncbi:MAG: hypothetical protein E6G83_16600 [Alphaproteobacteria bacterium]|nr:MAG: hypothetical protein E6G83_16600 [Alphaproteobacteria bacterium]